MYAMYLVFCQQRQVKQDLNRLSVSSHDHKLGYATVQRLGCCSMQEPLPFVASRKC